MNEPISFAPAGAYNFVVAACGLVITIWAVLEIISKCIEIGKKTNKMQDEKIKEVQARLDSHEKKFEEYDRFFQRDKSRLDKMDESERVTQKALLALLSHALNGNDTDALREARDDLQTYLTSK